MAVLKTSDQSCRCTWYKNSTVIRDSSEITTSFDGTNARLFIKKVSTKYVANYRVVIRNEFGEDESSADLTIIEEKVSIMSFKICHQSFLLNKYL